MAVTVGGLCFVQQLVAYVISNYVCAYAYALFVFWRRKNQILDQQGRWGLDQCRKVLDWCIGCGESIAIPAILRHANLIEIGAMRIEFTSLFILACTVVCFHRVSLEEEW